MMAKLLVSVRSASEAEAALEGGASIIDVKEPQHGALGCAATSAIVDVIQTVRGRVPVSAASGELIDHSEISLKLGLDFIKWGLARAGCNWRHRLLHASSEWLSNGNCQPVAVAYADWRQAQSPSTQDVLDFVRQNRWKVLLLDTFQKDGRTLLDWMSYDEIGEICWRCRKHGILIALAGSLGSKEISKLLPVQPDIFAVRGAVCGGRDRMATVDSTLVGRIADLLNSTEKAHITEVVSRPRSTAILAAEPAGKMPALPGTLPISKVYGQDL
jgi:uncharacterized protein (UPF0264 family)